MANYFLVAFLILFGLSLLIGTLGIPMWVTGAAAVIAGVLLLIGR